IGVTTRKNMAAATVANVIRLLRKSPYANVLWLIVNFRLPKSWAPKIAAMIGVRMSLTRALITAVNAVPITTATARSITLPRNRNFLKSRSSFVTGSRLVSLQGPVVPLAHARTLAIQVTYAEPQRQSRTGGGSTMRPYLVGATDCARNRARNDRGLGEGWISPLDLSPGVCRWTPRAQRRGGPVGGGPICRPGRRAQPRDRALVARPARQAATPYPGDDVASLPVTKGGPRLRPADRGALPPQRPADHERRAGA